MALELYAAGPHGNQPAQALDCRGHCSNPARDGSTYRDGTAVVALRRGRRTSASAARHAAFGTAGAPPWSARWTDGLPVPILPAAGVSHRLGWIPEHHRRGRLQPADCQVPTRRTLDGKRPWAAPAALPHFHRQPRPAPRCPWSQPSGYLPWPASGVLYHRSAAAAAPYHPADGDGGLHPRPSRRATSSASGRQWRNWPSPCAACHRLDAGPVVGTVPDHRRAPSCSHWRTMRRRGRGPSRMRASGTILLPWPKRARPGRAAAGRVTFAIPALPGLDWCVPWKSTPHAITPRGKVVRVGAPG